MSAGADVSAPRRRDTVDFGASTRILRWSGVALRWRVRTLLVGGVLLLLLAMLTSLALVLGDYPLAPDQVWGALVNDPDAGFARIVVVEWRAPRAIAAVLFGAALGVSGAVFQSLTRNPLASPDIIGFSAGSFTGALIVILLVHGTYLQVAGGAVVGGMITAIFVYLFAWRRGVQGFRLIVVGIAVSAMLASFNAWLMLTADIEVAMSAAAWGAGSLAGAGWEQVGVGGAAIALLLVGVCVLAPGLRQLELGDDAARASGVRVEPLRLGVMAVGVALIAVVTAAAGPISFIALAAPQIARRMTAGAGMPLAPAALMGAVLLAAADVIAQHLLPVALPVGVVSLVLGGAYLVWLIGREVRRRA